MKKIEELERAFEESYNILWDKTLLLLHPKDAERLRSNYFSLKKLIQEIKNEKD
jgi:hypothetical protein